MVLSMLNQLCLGPVWEPQEVDVFGKGREFTAPSLESLLALVHDEAHSEIAPYSPKNQLCIHLFNNHTVIVTDSILYLKVLTLSMDKKYRQMERW